MKTNDTVVAEVLNDGEVIVYEPSLFDSADVGPFIDLWGPMEDRNFFEATITLTPLQER